MPYDDAHPRAWRSANYSLQVSDAGLKYLTGLKKTQRIDLSHTKVTAEGAKKLKEALPDCNVSID
jgi:hypothetical protein